MTENNKNAVPQKCSHEIWAKGILQSKYQASDQCFSAIFASAYKEKYSASKVVMGKKKFRQ